MLGNNRPAIRFLSAFSILVTNSLLSFHVAAQVFISGNDLKEICEENLYACRTFVGGVIEEHDRSANVDWLIAWRNASEKKPPKSDYLSFCTPSGGRLSQMTDVVIKHNQNTPEQRHKSAAWVVLIALNRSFPCTN